MAWVDKRTNWRLRDRVGGGKPITVVRNLGTFKGHAVMWLEDYRKAKRLGFAPTLLPIEVSDIAEFIKAKSEGREAVKLLRRIPIEEFCDFYLLKHGPSLKGGISDNKRSSYYDRKYWVGRVKLFWSGKYADEITPLDVRDYLAQFKTVGTVMRYLGYLTHMFRTMAEYNEDGTLTPTVRLPPYNPGTKWRRKMKPAEKYEHPDTRVLSREEWFQFSQYLKPRTFAICDIALRRFLRVADIKKLNELSSSHGSLRGKQQKTGMPFSVPDIAGQPIRYNFKNFKRDFRSAQKKAGMDYPANHPHHFSVKDLRRTGATWAWRDTKDLATISAMLGHLDWKTTKRYLNIEEVDKLKIAAVVDRLAKKAS